MNSLRNLVLRRGALLAIAAVALGTSACGGGDSGNKKGSSSSQGGQGGAADTGGTTGVFASGGASGGAAGPAGCSPTGSDCQTSGQCCEGNVCNKTGQVPEWLGCRKACSDSAECAEGCCLHFEGQTFGFCTDTKWCQSCGAMGTACGSMLPACCADQFCVGNDPQATTSACRQKCAANSDCATVCCLEVVTGVKVCLDPMYCPRE